MFSREIMENFSGNYCKSQAGFVSDAAMQGLKVGFTNEM